MSLPAPRWRWGVADWPLFDPRRSQATRQLIEHLTELIVIIALAGAGLAIDRPAGTHEWRHSWILLAVVMPVTIAVMFVLGSWVGLSVASALLLAAALAPTDPVLAREVAVSGPNQGDDDDVRVSLTTEAGLNDGLAFPFVWLAMLLAEVTPTNALSWSHWLSSYVLWHTAAALGVGWAIGAASARFVHGPWGDARLNGENAGLVVLGTTFLAYGATEMINGYGFLAVFVAARVGRGFGRDIGGDGYAAKPHRYADQFEKVLLAILLLWLGGFAASGALAGTTWRECAVALALVFVVRPVVAFAALAMTRGDHFEHLAIAFFGIRGLGSFYYVAFAVGHGGFGETDAVWRITSLAVLLSIGVHGALAPIIMARLSLKRHARARQGRRSRRS